MARKHRIHYPGAVYHVILRGNTGQKIFLNDKDRILFYKLLEDGTERFGYRVHAFCLMPNHVHLALQVSDIPLSRGMQNLSFRYTQWFNFKYDRVGHLFQGRFKSIVIEQDNYLLELTRYIHLNPVRAGLADDPGSFDWSSFAAYLGLSHLPWLTTDWVMAQFGESEPDAQSRYAAFVRDALNEESPPEFHKGKQDVRILGSDEFTEQCLSVEGQVALDLSVADILEAVCGEYSLTTDKLTSSVQKRNIAEARAVIAWLARELGCGTFTAVGNLINRDVGSVSSAVRRLEVKLNKDVDLKGRVGKLKTALSQS